MIKILDKLLLFIYSLIVLAIAAVLIWLGAAFSSWEDIASNAQSALGISWPGPAVAAAGGVLVLISLRFLLLMLRRSRGGTPSIDQRSEFGEISISLETVENLSLKAASRVKGVKDLKTRVRVSNAGLEISLRTIVDGEHSIPDLTEDVQKSVKEHIEEITGVPVANVSVYVANIIQSTTFRSRVE